MNQINFLMLWKSKQGFVILSAPRKTHGGEPVSNGEAFHHKILFNTCIVCVSNTFHKHAMSSVDSFIFCSFGITRSSRHDWSAKQGKIVHFVYFWRVLGIILDTFWNLYFGAMSCKTSWYEFEDIIKSNINLMYYEQMFQWSINLSLFNFA